ncbi:hypothetical protein [Streptosporangium sp. NPDC048865]|uniref:hypothetical protein n=1 Tax=Streptosporangium sp. NPDC048865 TaxID=3155766 RepID=UPI0034472F57
MTGMFIRTFPCHAALVPLESITDGTVEGFAALTEDGRVISLVKDIVPEPLPPLVRLELDDDRVEVDVLLDVGHILGSLREVPGVLVERDGRPYGVVDRVDLAAALRVEDLGWINERIFGTPAVPSRRYVCRQCVPEEWRVPRSAAAGPPECRDAWSHGPMQLQGG